eukprot:2867132-Pleurochrysis_carterae.AAC.1
MHGRQERTDGREGGRRQAQRAGPAPWRGGDGASPWLRQGDATTQGPRRRTEEVGAGDPPGPWCPSQSRREGRLASRRVRRL